AMVFVNVPRSLLKTSDPMVFVPSKVAVRLAVWSILSEVAAPLNTAEAPTALGAVAGNQLKSMPQLAEPLETFQVSAEAIVVDSNPIATQTADLQMVFITVLQRKFDAILGRHKLRRNDEAVDGADLDNTAH